MKYTTVVTSGGLSAIASAVQAGTKVDITHMAVGDGGGTEYAPDPNQTSIKGERWRGQITGYQRTNNQFTVTASMPASTETFVIRELGLYTADGICFAVSNVPSIPHMSEADGLSMEFDAIIPFMVDNADSVQITVNPFGALSQDLVGKPGGVAGLDGTGHVPAEQLPPLNFDPAGTAQGVRNELNGHIANRENPHGVTKIQLGLDRVDNTPDAEKHVSYANTAGNANALNGVAAGSYSQVVTGTYIKPANGEIILGFKPKAVIISKNNGAFEHSGIPTGGMVTNLSPVSIASSYPCIKINENGFSVYSVKDADNNADSDNFVPYNYIAFR